MAERLEQICLGRGSNGVEESHPGWGRLITCTQIFV